MNRGFQRTLLMVLAIVLALLPLVELVDQWESYGSDPEFVSVCTVLGNGFGILLAFRRAILSCLRRLWPNSFFTQPIGGSHLYISRCHSSDFPPHTSPHPDLDTSCLG